MHEELERYDDNMKFVEILLDPGTVLLRRLPSSVIDAVTRRLPITDEMQNLIDGRPLEVGIQSLETKGKVTIGAQAKVYA